MQTNDGIFRAKSAETGEWVYGYLAPENKMVVKSDNGYKSVDIDRITLGEYVRRKDINGYRIFTGDIVRYRADFLEEYEGCDPDGVIGVVTFCDTFCGFTVNTEPYKNLTMYRNDSLVNYKVIGNIYDNQYAEWSTGLIW